jgi:hypothetical protein
MSKSALGVAAIVAAVVGSNAWAADLPVKAPKPAPPPPPFFIVNQNSVSYSYVFNGTNPGAGTTPKHVLNYTHFDVWQYGTNFFTVDWLKATNGAAPPNGTPAAPCDRGPAFNPPGADPNRCAGYTEIYGLFRSTFGWNQIFGTKAFSAGPLTNIEFAVGADLNTDNTTLGSAKRSMQGGVQFDFAAPYHGFVNVGVFAYHEWQNDGFSALFGPNFSGKVNFDTTWAIEALYVQPLGFLPDYLPVTFKSLAVIHGPKGAGEIGVPQRITEYLTQQTLSLDVGKMVTGKSDMVSVWVAYRWWKNKFGLDPVATGFNATLESTAVTGVTFAF